MLARIAADCVVGIHFLFIVFVMAGGVLAVKWRWVVFVHLPCAAWGALIEFSGWVCPLTPLEWRLRDLAGESGYTGGFIEHYILPVVYPPGLTRHVQIALGVAVLSINILVYALLIKQCLRTKNEDAT